MIATARDSRLFVNRVDELRAAHESVEASVNVLVAGERGSGKTTFLRYLSRDLEQAGWRAVFVEGALARTPVELLTLIRARVTPTIELGGVADAFLASVHAVQALNRPRTVPRKPSGEAGESVALLELVTELADDVSQENRRLVVLIDEVSSAEIVHTIFGRLRDEIWQLPIVWVVAGHSNDLLSLRRPPADAFFPRVIRLDALDDKLALRLLRLRIPRSTASDGLLRAIVAESSRLPRSLVDTASAVIVHGTHLDQLAVSREKRERTLDSLGEAARRVVEELEANGPASASDDAFLTRLGVGRSRVAQVFRDLERLGIVEASMDQSYAGSRRKVYGLKEPG